MKYGIKIAHTTVSTAACRRETAVRRRSNTPGNSQAKGLQADITLWREVKHDLTHRRGKALR